MDRPHWPRIGQFRLKAHGSAAHDVGQLQMRDRKLQRQLARLARLQRQVSALALQRLHLEVQQAGSSPARSRTGIRNLRRRRLLCFMQKVRPWRHIHFKPLQPHHRDANHLARFVVDRRMKPELLELDQWLIGCYLLRSRPLTPRYCHARHLRRRPDPEPVAFHPQPVPQ